MGSIPWSGVRLPKSRVHRFHSLTKFPVGVGLSTVNTDNDDDGSTTTLTCSRIKFRFIPIWGIIRSLRGLSQIHTRGMLEIHSNAI